MDKRPVSIAAAMLAASGLLLSTSTIGLAQEKPSLRWGTDPSGGGPYVFQTRDGTYTGFEHDLAAYLAGKIGRAPVMCKGDWIKLPDLLNKPPADPSAIDIVLNGYELKPSLTEKYAATIPYYVYRLQLVARKGDDTFNDWSDLTHVSVGGKRPVYVLTASVAQAYVTSKFGNDVAVQSSDDVSNVFGLVEKGTTAVTVQDNPGAIYYIAQSGKTNPGGGLLKSVGQPRQPGHYVIYTRSSDIGLRDELNAAIKAGFQDGTLQKIYRKYDLWNADQDGLAFHLTGTWPADDDETVRAEADSTENPWPRMIRELLWAAGMTVFLSVTSFPIAMMLGMAVALGRVYGPGWVNVLFGIYVETLRGTPLLLQLYFAFYLIPDAIPWLAFSPIQAGILGLAINYSAYESENYRAGLLAIPRGQTEAGLALGMSPWTVLRVVIVPQAVRVVVPPVTNDFIALFKDTSVCSVILITELTRKYNELYNFNRGYIVELAFITAGLYLLMSFPLAIVARRLERRLQPTRTGGRR